MVTKSEAMLFIHGQTGILEDAMGNYGNDEWSQVHEDAFSAILDGYEGNDDIYNDATALIYMGGTFGEADAYNHWKG